MLLQVQYGQFAPCLYAHHYTAPTQRAALQQSLRALQATEPVGVCWAQLCHAVDVNASVTRLQSMLWYISCIVLQDSLSKIANVLMQSPWAPQICIVQGGAYA